MPEGQDQFDSSRAELFEALGHPARVRILRALEKRQLGFAELKREVGIESSGHLQFHLGKLTGLVGTSGDGSYSLTDDGKEAIRVLNLTSSGSEEIAIRAKVPSPRRANRTLLFLALLLVSMIVLAGVVVYQQQQIAALNQSLATGTVTIGQKTYYYEDLSLGSVGGSSVTFHGVKFAFAGMTGVSYSNLTNYTAEGSVKLTNGTTLDLNGKTVRVAVSFSIPKDCQPSLTSADNETSGMLVSWVMPPMITITFGDGSHETYNGSNVTARYDGGLGYPSATVWLTYTSQTDLPNPWFGPHTNPQAGVFLNCMSPQSDLTIYVSG